jgi:hypothetical protein
MLLQDELLPVASTPVDITMPVLLTSTEPVSTDTSDESRVPVLIDPVAIMPVSDAIVLVEVPIDSGITAPVDAYDIGMREEMRVAINITLILFLQK